MYSGTDFLEFLFVNSDIPTPGQRVQQLLLSNNDKILFAGSAEGSITCHMWGTETPTEGQQYHIARGPVTALAASADDCTLFAAGEDGSLFQFDIHLTDKATSEVLTNKAVDPATFFDVVLVTRADMEAQILKSFAYTEFILSARDIDVCWFSIQKPLHRSGVYAGH
jgi:hypothetical protein